MGTDVTQERQQAHAQLDMLPVERFIAVRSVLEVMVESVSRSLASAPAEEEENHPRNDGRYRTALALRWLAEKAFLTKHSLD